MELHLMGGGLKRNFDRNESKILEKMVESTKARTVVIIPSASEQDTHEISAMYTPFFKHYGVQTVYTPEIKTPSDANNPEYLSQIDEADLVLFSGGDQLRLVDILNNTKLLQTIKDRFKKDMSIAGNSAGATAVSNPMINPDAETNVLKIVPGLDILKSIGIYNMGIDTHLFAESRIPRPERDVNYLLNPDSVLNTIIGLGEDTALFIKDSLDAEVVGTKEVLINQRLFDNEGSVYVKVKRFQHGQKFNLTDYMV